DKDYLAHGWGFAWPANRRILYNRASADLNGKPWSERKKLIWWDPAAPGQVPDKKGERGGPGPPRLYRVPRPPRQERRQAVHHAGGPGRRLLRPAQRRAVPGALRAGGVTHQEPPLQAADEPGGQGLAGARPEKRPGPGGLLGVPVPCHHVPADRAPSLGSDVALPAHARRAVPLALRGDQPRAGRGTQDRQR